jgi:hypothetical protein
MRTKRAATEFPSGTSLILQPGWSGTLGDDELDFIVTELRRRPGLRVTWGFKQKQQRFSRDTIKHVALYGEPHSEDCLCDYK